MFFKMKGSEAHIGKEWDLDDESSSDNEGVATLAFNKSHLFPQGPPQVPHGKGD
jgi:hypothetical protein